MPWDVTADGDYYIFEGQVLIPLDAANGVAQLLLRPLGGMLIGVPPIEKGDPGVPANLDTAVDVTPLAYDDPTPDSASFVVVTPPTETTPGVYRLSQTQRTGQDGPPGTVELDISAMGGTPALGMFPAVDAALTGFDLQYQRVGDRYLPATIYTTVASGAATLAIVAVPGQNFDWRPHCEGYTVIDAGISFNVTADLLVRMDDETGGDIVARCPGVTYHERLTLTSAPPAGSADEFDRIPMGQAATFYLRTERQTGASTYSVSASTTRFSVRVMPIL